MNKLVLKPVDTELLIPMLIQTRQFLDVCNHQEALEKLPLMLEQHGPIDAFIIRMGRPPYRPFDKIFNTSHTTLQNHCLSSSRL